jgi:iron(III) transport system substrate-binding protein
MAMRGLALLVAVVALLACSAPPPAAPPTSPPSPASQQAATSSAAGTASGWDAIEAAAHNENTLIIDNGAAAAGQTVLDAFQTRYPWLQLQVTTLQASQFTARAMTEQRNGLYAWDLLLGAGFNNVDQVLAPAGAVDDVRPILADLPADVKDDSKWAGGFLWLRSQSSADSLVTDLGAQWGVYVNRQQIPADQLSSITQLTDPKFKGKIVIYNPNSSGAGSQTLANILSHTDAGFVTRIMTDQAPVYTMDSNQASQFLAEGRYPIAIGVTASSLQPFVSQGLGSQVEPLREEANSFMHASGFTVMKNPPHPNAMRVFLDWFLSQEGQTTWNQSSVTAASRRLDVTVTNPDAQPDWAHLQDYKVIFDTPSGNDLLQQMLQIAASAHPS